MSMPDQEKVAVKSPPAPQIDTGTLPAAEPITVGNTLQEETAQRTGILQQPTTTIFADELPQRHPAAMPASPGNTLPKDLIPPSAPQERGQPLTAPAQPTERAGRAAEPQGLLDNTREETSPVYYVRFSERSQRETLTRGAVLLDNRGTGARVMAADKDQRLGESSTEPARAEEPIRAENRDHEAATPAASAGNGRGPGDGDGRDKITGGPGEGEPHDPGEPGQPENPEQPGTSPHEPLVATEDKPQISAATSETVNLPTLEFMRSVPDRYPEENLVQMVADAIAHAPEVIDDEPDTHLQPISEYEEIPQDHHIIYVSSREGYHELAMETIRQSGGNEETLRIIMQEADRQADELGERDAVGMVYGLRFVKVRSSRDSKDMVIKRNPFVYGVTKMDLENERNMQQLNPDIQSARFEDIRQAATPEEAFCAILDVETTPRATADLPSQIILPASISDHLDATTSESIEAGRERSELIGWDVEKRDFALGRVHKGAKSINFNPDLPLNALFLRAKPLIDFHTHPSGNDTFFSSQDLASTLSQKSHARMIMVGNAVGGYVLIPTEQHKPKNLIAAQRYVRQLRKAASQSEIGLWETVFRLEEDGIGVYEWRSDNFARNSGVGFQLTRSIDGLRQLLNKTD